VALESRVEAAPVSGAGVRQEPLYLSIQALAARYGRPVETIRTWRKRGLLPVAYRFGGSLHWRREDVELWESRCREKVACPDVQYSHKRSLHGGAR